MKRLPSKEEHVSDPVVQRIWEEIVCSMDQYTHDSTFSKFYLPENILIHCRSSATIFTQLLYRPIPSSEIAQGTRLYSLFYLSMTYGVQIFLKERNINKGHVPFEITTNPHDIRAARNMVGKSLSEGIKVKSPVSQVMDIFLIQLNAHQYMRKFIIRGREFNSEKFDNLLPASIMWGYLTAQELIREKNTELRIEGS